MVPRWKRVLLSLISFILAVALSCFLLSIRVVIAASEASFRTFPPIYPAKLCP